LHVVHCHDHGRVRGEHAQHREDAREECGLVDASRRRRSLQPRGTERQLLRFRQPVEHVARNRAEEVDQT
jgi:hypothetical protein